MSLINVNWRPDDRELRRFAWIGVLAAVVLAFVLHFVKGLDLRWCAVIVGAGGALGLSPFVSLRITRAVYLLLVGATLPIGLVVSFVSMSLFFFLLITPTAMFFRLTGRDPLQRRFDPKARTYWLPRQPPNRPERYFQQF
jgi:hypothetical protein